MFRWKHPRPVLNEIKWRYDLSKCRVYFIHRGVPGDTRIVDGSDIKNIDRSYLVLEGFQEDVYIPYHRIFRISSKSNSLTDDQWTGLWFDYRNGAGQVSVFFYIKNIHSGLFDHK